MRHADKETMKTLKLDIEKYQALLDGSDMTDEEKEEYIRTLWSVIVSFVDLGFSVQPRENTCGKLPDERAMSTLEPAKVVDCGYGIAKSEPKALAVGFTEATKGGEHDV